MRMNDVMMTRVVTSSEGFVVCVVIVVLRCSPHDGIIILSSSWIADYHLNVAWTLLVPSLIGRMGLISVRCGFDLVIVVGVAASCVVSGDLYCLH